MNLLLCLACHHPLIYHSAAGCDEILEMDDDGYPEVCRCNVVGLFGEAGPRRRGEGDDA